MRFLISWLPSQLDPQRAPRTGERENEGASHRQQSEKERKAAPEEMEEVGTKGEKLSNTRQSRKQRRKEGRRESLENREVFQSEVREEQLARCASALTSENPALEPL